MKSFQHAESTQSASTHYAPSVPMSVYRELATELRANKAVIDSLNSRNHQLMQQNQRLKQEIHNVVQATLNLGQFAGVARQAQPDGFHSEFPGEIGPDTLSRLVRAQSEAQAVDSETSESSATQPVTDQEAPDLVREIAQAAAVQAAARRPQPSVAVPSQLRQRAPRPIQNDKVSDRANDGRTRDNRTNDNRAKAKAPEREAMPKRKPAAKQKAPKPAKPARQTSQKPNGKTNSKTADLMAIPSTQAMSKLFTEQSGEYRSSVMESSEEKEIGGIWLALSIVLIIVTAFGAGFLIMKPLLNDR